MIMVFSKNEKDKLVANGLKFICEQPMSNGVGYIFQGDNRINFEKEDIRYVRINKLHL